MSIEQADVNIEKLLCCYLPERSSIIPLLQAVQGELGYLPKHAIEKISEYTRIPKSEIFGVATFYTQFRFNPIGKHLFTVCRGTACHVLGSQRLVEDLEQLLCIKAGETTADMMFSIQTVACFGSCALAPLLVVNDKVYGRMTTQKLRKLLDVLRDNKSSDSEESDNGDGLKAEGAKQ